MSDHYLPAWATAQEASEWLESETGQAWPLVRLLETVHKLSVWIDCADDEPDHIIEGLFQGQREGFRAEVIFASDIERLKFVRDGGTLHISRRPDGALVRFTPPIKFPVDELRFEADCVRRVATIVGATQTLSEPIKQGGASAGTKAGIKRRPQTNAERVAAAKHAASVNVSSRGYWPPRQTAELEGIDWSHWAKLREVRVYEALALLDGQEPPENCPDADDESPTYRKRMRLLLDALSDSEWFGPPKVISGDRLLQRVNLAEVGRWGKANGYALPNEFPSAVAQAASVQVRETIGPVIRWKLWMSAPLVELWQAVALVLSIEPSSLKRSGQAWMAGPGRGPIFEPHSFPSATSRDDFNTAMDFAERAANVAGPIHLNTGLSVGMNKREAQVSLQEVVAYFVSCDWPDIPTPLQTLGLASTGSPTVEATKPSASEESAIAPSVEATTLPPLATPDIALAFDGVGEQTESQWRRKLGDVNNHQWVLPARAHQAAAPNPATWWPIAFAELLIQRGASEGSLNVAFMNAPKLRPWLSLWQEKRRERNAFGR